MRPTYIYHLNLYNYLTTNNYGASVDAILGIICT